ncbi:MAG: type II toxin-antitoxin system HicB family antitoxin [Candidatus Thiodiazotropha sp. (ex Epidulcina cf. delphinae)]|nr:type II toxin-antitoxin system HicB family antitoxin [Candidatus Thiodiazotropha sp. (ex Epidulcina cf. delphinae)]
MSNHLKYGEYLGSVEIDTENDTIHGKILFINDLVTYQAESLPQLRSEFEAAVNDYLETCTIVGKEPDKPYKGTFNVRLGPDLHRKAAVATALSGFTSLNDFIKKAVEDKLKGSSTVEYHQHIYAHYKAGEFITEFNQTVDEIPWQAEKPVLKSSH